MFKLPPYFRLKKDFETICEAFLDFPGNMRTFFNGFSGKVEAIEFFDDHGKKWRYEAGKNGIRHIYLYDDITNERLPFGWDASTVEKPKYVFVFEKPNER